MGRARRPESSGGGGDGERPQARPTTLAVAWRPVVSAVVEACQRAGHDHRDKNGVGELVAPGGQSTVCWRTGR